MWALVTDINLPGRFSTEFLGAEWAGDERGVGAVFHGRNQHSAIGEWTIPCYVDTFDEGRAFGWCTSDAQQPGARWKFELDASVGRTRLRFSYVMGPGRSGTTRAIEMNPGKEASRPAASTRRGAGEHGAHRAGHQDAGRDEMTLRIGLTAMPFTAQGIELALQAERLGVDSIWMPEFWAADALTPLAFLAARTTTIRLATGIVQLGARTPAMLAMSAQSLQVLSAGRFVLGIGTSGPQVMEGWHGVRFDRPVRRTRETIEIVRKIAAGERLTHDGEIYRLPLPGGEGRPIRSLMAPAPIPIYVASLGPANLRLTGELADGWIGNSFFPESAGAFFDPIRDGAAAAGRSLADLDLTVAVGVEFTDDVDGASRRHADGYAFTFGAMGSATTNFYSNAFERQGYGDDVRAVQQLWAAGDRDAARRRVPTAIGFGTNLIGTDDTVRQRLRLYRDAGVTMLRTHLQGDVVHAARPSGRRSGPPHGPRRRDQRRARSAALM